ncbi:YdcF family protein [Macrococcus carouselicus]|nr:YdcF family protein [Macrococcus carouselicus]
MKRIKLMYVLIVFLFFIIFIIGESIIFPAGESAEPSDIIIVLNGDTGRLEEAARLYHKGYGEKVLLTPVTDDKFNNFLSVNKATELGIPETALIIDYEATSTYQNAVIAKNVMIEHNFNRAVIVTSDYHVKRTRLVFNRVVPDHFTLCYVGTLNNKGQKWYQRKDRQFIWEREFLRNWGYRFGLYKWIDL